MKPREFSPYVTSETPPLASIAAPELVCVENLANGLVPALRDAANFLRRQGKVNLASAVDGYAETYLDLVDVLADPTAI